MTSAQSPFRTILWDNDGVLVDTERLYFQATREIMAEAGVDLDERTFEAFFLSASKGAWHLVAEQGYGEADIERLRARRDRRHSELLAQPGLAMKGAGAVLAALAQRMTMAVVTSAWREHFELSHQHTGFRRHFSLELTREDYERSKPDPEPYRTAVQRLGARPSQCLVIEDSVRGLTAAKAAGLTCWVIPTGLSAGGDFGAADRVLGRITEVLALLG